MEKNNYRAEDIFGTGLSEEEAVRRIRSDRKTYEKYQSFPESFRKEVLEFYEGIKGAPLLYDVFFRKIFDPAEHPDRVERFISALLGQEVRIKEVLTREGSQLADRGSLVIMDIIVELEDGSYVDVEMQKEGYLFPSQRSSCYTADMIMRQYNRKKAQKEKDGKAFSYKDITTVYLFVLMEKHSKEFRGSKKYIHKREVSYSSGVKLSEIAQITYITLDTFDKTSDNNDDELSAWLTLLIKSDAESVIKLVGMHPEFRDIYREIAIFRKDPKELIRMFSEALYEMDKATERYMIEELQDDVKTANLRADQEKDRADKAEDRADKAEDRADKEKNRADKAEREIAELKKEIQRLQLGAVNK